MDEDEKAGGEESHEEACCGLADHGLLCGCLLVENKSVSDRESSAWVVEAEAKKKKRGGREEGAVCLYTITKSSDNLMRARF